MTLLRTFLALLVFAALGLFLFSNVLHIAIGENKISRSKARPKKPVDALTGCRHSENFTGGEYETCRLLLRGLPANNHSWLRRGTTSNSSSASKRDKFNWNCDCLRLHNVSVAQEELDFPLAFSLLTYDNAAQTLRLLRLIHRPHNFYCLHVDAKASPAMHRAAARAATCLENVVVASPPIDVTWGDVTVLIAELMCARKLLQLDLGWKYFINLVGRDFPLRTNLELVRILSVYNGSNDVSFNEMVNPSTGQKRRHWYCYVWKAGKRTKELRRQFNKTPRGLRLIKGSTHVAVTRQFLHYAVYNQTAVDLLDYISDLHVPDEHFFSTLNFNPAFNIPGAFTGSDPASKPCLTRAKRWQTSQNVWCAGRWIRSICNVGAGDLPWIVNSTALFLNKIRAEHDETAYRCLELWYIGRLRQPGTDLSTENGKSQFDLDYYRKLPFVTQHV